MNKFVFFIFSLYASVSEAMKPIEVYQRGGLHPSRWLHVATIDIPDQYHQINSLYYARPDEGNELLSVSGEPSFYHLSGHSVQGATGLSADFLNEISQAGWWHPEDAGSKLVDVYQRGGNHPSKWVFVKKVNIPDQYHQINSLYYARANEGNELLSVSGEPSFYHLSGHSVQGATGLSADFLNEISQAGWWGPTLQIGQGFGGLSRVLTSGLNYILKWSLQ